MEHGDNDVTSDDAFQPPSSDLDLLPPPLLTSSSGGGGGARYKLMSPAKLPISRSTSITVPPGMSPTAFLESPVFLTNMKAEPSPTTGSLFKPQISHGSIGSATLSSISSFFSYSTPDNRNSNGFEFRLPSTLNSGSGLASAVHMNFAENCVPNTGEISKSQGQSNSQSFDLVKSELPTSYNNITAPEPANMVPPTIVSSDVENPNGPDIEQNVIDIQSSESDDKGIGTPSISDKTSDDGFNWRKYGQKHVKGSEFPRSYYKCTYPNCEVKKLFERSHTGQITEIICKGTHEHPKPQPTWRFAAGTFPAFTDKGSDRLSSIMSQGGKPSGLYGHSDLNKLELSSSAAAYDTRQGQVTHTDGTHNESDSDDAYAKWMKMDISEITPIIKPIREPRVVVQTLSEVDILDDGYRWRKYGQKVVRGNPNPRSYYKCTCVGCPVRKHVERASHDPKAVITTYEGKHNHELPIAKNRSNEPAPNETQMTRYRSEEAGHVSLNLGVGNSHASEARSNEQHQQTDGVQRDTLQNEACNYPLQAIPASRYHPYPSGQNPGGSYSFGPPPPISNSTNPYQCNNFGRIVMGP